MSIKEIDQRIHIDVNMQTQILAKPMDLKTSLVYAFEAAVQKSGKFCITTKPTIKARTDEN